MTCSQYFDLKRIMNGINLAAKVLYDNSTDLESDYDLLFKNVCPFLTKDKSPIQFMDTEEAIVYPIVINSGYRSSKCLHRILIDENSLVKKGFTWKIDYNKYMDCDKVPERFYPLLDKFINDVISTFNIEQLYSNINSLIIQRGY